ncbi:Rid family hydrolase [Sphingorhabdus sp. Alg231-15]|uniref:Rid family hydrolase n=1 Tax=Sphingorhabdus sp. Alg231-15 TaxID=1922222 RepID=UPI000D55E85F
MQHIKILITAMAAVFILINAPAVHAQKQVIIPESLKESYENFRFAPAVRAGDMVYLSGVVARLKDDETDADIRPAVIRAFEEIEMILKASGGDWSDVVDVTSYLTDLDKYVGPMWAVKEERVPAPYPAWTAIGVSQLFGGEKAIIEIKVTAYLPTADSED